jgi:hypothetical protein
MGCMVHVGRVVDADFVMKNIRGQININIRDSSVFVQRKEFG